VFSVWSVAGLSPRRAEFNHDSASGICFGKVALGLVSVGVRSGFTVKQIKLKFQGPSYARTSSKALGGTLLCLILIRNSLFFFINRTPKSYKLQDPQNLDPSVLRVLLFSPVSIISPMLHIRLSLILLLSEGQAGKPEEPSNKAMFFRVWQWWIIERLL